MKNGLTLFLVIFLSSKGFAASSGQSCPDAGETNHYTETKLYPFDQSSDEKVLLFYFTAKPFDESKPTLLHLDGGPGGFTMPENATEASEYNIVYVHNRGSGCSRLLGPYIPRYRTPMFTTKYLVEDLEAVRKKIVGEDGHWFVYGISYGATLAQAYTIKYADHVDGLVLDSAIYGTSEVTVARTQFLDLFINGIEDVRELFNEVISKFPEVKNDVLRLAFYSASNYQGRIYFPTLLNGLKGKSSLLEARTFLQKYYVAPKPMLGMAREIACREMYDYPSNEPAIEYYFPGLDADCKSYEAFKEPFDFSRSLKNLKTRTLVWGGKYDPMTPLQSMQRMHQWIANSLLWSNEFVGHGLIREKPDCAKNLLSLFISKQSDQDIKTAIASDSCQSEPQ